MFIKRKEYKEVLERLHKLENPFKFKIGDKVKHTRIHNLFNTQYVLDLNENNTFIIIGREYSPSLCFKYYKILNLRTKADFIMNEGEICAV